MTVLDSLFELTDAELLALSPERQAQWRRHVERETLLASPCSFAAASSHGLWQPYRHLVYTSERIVAMVEGNECDCLVIEEPVRHGKTELCSRWTPAWYVLKHRGRVGLASYEADFAATHGRRAREIVSENGPALGVQIDDTSRAAHRWEVVGSDAGMWTAGAGGPITGKGANLLVVDDPIKNAEEANSATVRDHLWEWWNTTLLTRREPGGKLLLIMSRWHDDDLVARVLAHKGGMRVERIRLPALAEEDDPLGRVPGQALCPERYDEVDLAGTRADVGPGPWSALYQQRPAPAGGGMFRRSGFRYWTSTTAAAGEFYHLGDKMVDASECWRFATMDPAYTRTKRSDYTVLAMWAVAPTDPSSLLLLDVQRVRVESTEHAPMVRAAWDTWKPAWIGVEKQNATLSLFTEVQRDGVVIRELNADRNKIARAETAAALLDVGRIWFPRDAPWMSEFAYELLSFPAAAHDDCVDVLAYAAIELARGSVRAHRHRQVPITREERCWAWIKDREKASTLHPVMGRI